MNSKPMFRALLASILAVAMALPGVGRADGPYHDSPYPGRPPYRAPYYYPHYPRPYPHYYPHYYGGYYPAYPSYPAYSCNNCGKQQHHHNNHSGDNNDLWYGLLGGGVLGYALGNVFPYPHLNQDYVPPPDNTAPPPPKP